MTFELKFTETGLASRSAAAAARKLVEDNLRAGNAVAIDLSNVLSISSSYADELFGILVELYGLGQIACSVQLRNSAPNVLRQIATAIQYRLNRTSASGGVSAAAIAAEALERKRQSCLEFAY